jgi:low molecular weight phosphotyrosine protein phosphatase
MAEAAFRATVKQLGHEKRFNTIDSCGTAGYHTGEQPDSRRCSSFSTFGYRGGFSECFRGR